MTSDTAIINLLNEQLNTYKMLHNLLKKERACLINVQSEEVETISKEKDTIIMRLRLLEEERQRLIKQFAEEKGFNSDINLEELGRLTEKKVFIELRSQLMSILQSIEEMNKFNSILIDRTLNYIKTNTNFFNLFKTEHDSQSTGVLLSKET
ncbi:MAG: flagellar protein FlgN [Nitrospirae bacterium]|nr:flagellar protein FlgN [Nitrospirota bacterium]